MISSAVYLQASSVLKLVLLVFSISIYILLTQGPYSQLFDNRDLLLYVYEEYVHCFFFVEFQKLGHSEKIGIHVSVRQQRSKCYQYVNHKTSHGGEYVHTFVLCTVALFLHNVILHNVILRCA